jgi:hypothetical protein
MIFTNSQGYEYRIRLDVPEGQDFIRLDNIRIDHQDRPNMTLEEYFAFAGAEAERPYFEFMELEILDSLQEGNGLENRGRRTSILSPKSTSTSGSTGRTATLSRPG